MAENPKKRAKRQKAYNAKPVQKKRRAARNTARRRMIAVKGVVAMKGKDVDHKDGNPMNNSKKNLRAMSVKGNRGKGNNK